MCGKITVFFGLDGRVARLARTDVDTAAAAAEAAAERRGEEADDA